MSDWREMTIPELMKDKTYRWVAFTEFLLWIYAAYLLFTTQIQLLILVVILIEIRGIAAVYMFKKTE